MQSGKIKINKKYLRLRPTRTQPSRPRPRPRTTTLVLDDGATFCFNF